MNKSSSSSNNFVSNRKTTIQGYEHINDKDIKHIAYSKVFFVGG